MIRVSPRKRFKLAAGWNETSSYCCVVVVVVVASSSSSCSSAASNSRSSVIFPFSKFVCGLFSSSGFAFRPVRGAEPDKGGRFLLLLVVVIAGDIDLLEMLMLEVGFTLLLFEPKRIPLVLCRIVQMKVYMRAKISGDTITFVRMQFNRW